MVVKNWSKSSIFLDGITTGAAIEVKTEIANDVAEHIQKMMKRAGAELDKGEYHIKVDGLGGFLVLALRKDKSKNKKWFLNLTGNPVTFVRRTNLFGYGNPGQQVLDCFKVAVGSLEVRSKLKVPA